MSKSDEKDGEIWQLMLPKNLNVDTKDLVVHFAEALAAKLHKAEKKYGYTNHWRDPELIADLQQDLDDHYNKGDPLDVAAYCAFLWHHKVGIYE